jgi:hypothetical protein
MGTPALRVVGHGSVSGLAFLVQVDAMSGVSLEASRSANFPQPDLTGPPTRSIVDARRNTRINRRWLGVY